MRQLWQSLLTAFVLLVSSGCSSIPIKNISLYWPAGPDGAAVTHTISDDTSQLTKAEWEALSPQVVCESYDDFGWLRATLEKLCSDHKGYCKPEVQDKLRAFSRRTRIAAAKAKRKEH